VRAIRAFGTNSVTLTCAQGGSCKIGDTGPGGGKVFYIRPTVPLIDNWRYLEAAPQDSGYATLCDTNECNKVRFKTLEPWAIGKGEKNTKNLLSAPGVGSIKALIKKGINGKTDWFVPSSYEIFELYKQKDLVGGFVPDRYWSSTNNDIFTLLLDFDDGSEGANYKITINNLRLIRAFG
jgi:hypothetical protein